VRDAALLNIGAPVGLDVAGEQTGNPGDSNVHFGYHFVVTDQAPDGSWGTVRLWRSKDAAVALGDLSSAPEQEVEVEAGLRNLGGAYTMVVYSDFDEAVAQLASEPPGAVPVAADPGAVADAVRTGGAAALETLRVSLNEARAVAWAGSVPSGVEARFAYRVAVTASSAPALVVVNEVHGPATAGALDRLTLTRVLRHRVWLPVVKQSQ
jgi:hypothetical protein